jgi:hypothetical protein
MLYGALTSAASGRVDVDALRDVVDVILAY